MHVVCRRSPLLSPAQKGNGADYIRNNLHKLKFNIHLKYWIFYVWQTNISYLFFRLEKFIFKSYGPFGGNLIFQNFENVDGFFLKNTIFEGYGPYGGNFTFQKP